MPGSLTCLIWLILGAFAVGIKGFMIAGLLPTLARDLNIGLAAAGPWVSDPQKQKIPLTEGRGLPLAAGTVLRVSNTWQSRT